MLNTESKEAISALHQSSAHGFFLASPLDATKLIQSIFKTFPKTINAELKEVIVLNHLRDAEIALSMHGELINRDKVLPEDWPALQKFDTYIANRKKYYASPVITAHPTEVLSDHAQALIHAIVVRALEYQRLLAGGKQVKLLEEEIEEIISQIIAEKMLPIVNLSPEDEMKRQDHLYLNMMESWPKFNEQNITDISRYLGISKDEIKLRLTEANRFSFQNVSSWAVADIDGNKKRTRQTMEHMESSLQTSILERYLEKLEPLIGEVPSLKSVCDYLKRCQMAIRDGIYFNLTGAEVAKKRLISFLEKILSAEDLSRRCHDELRYLKDYVELVGFRGDLKQFVRESSFANSEIFQNFVLILQEHFPEIKALHESNGNYQHWSDESKSRLHHLMRVDSSYFRVLKDNQSLLTKETLRELDILDFVIEYQDQFSYILSDTINYHSLDDVIILFGFAAYLHRKLYIDDIRRPPVNLIPLCETPDDLANLVHILDAMLANPYLREVIIAKGQLTYVAGPSDLGKEGGIFSHIELIEAEKNAAQILRHHQKLDPRLESVKLRVLYGLGSDVHRRVSKSSAQLFCTFQGSDASALASVGSYQAYVEQVMGKMSENTARAYELQLIEENSPEDYSILKQMVSHAIEAYRKFTFHPASLELFRKLTIPYHLGILTNTSSRGESKGSVPKDIVKSRAIGIANYDVASLCMLRLFMSADGLVDLPIEIKKRLPFLYEHSSVVKEQILKLLFSIAVIQESFVFQKVFKAPPSYYQLKELGEQFMAKVEDENSKNYTQALGYVFFRLPKILHALIGFLPELVQARAFKFLDENKGMNISSLALGLIECIGQSDELFLSLYQEITNDLLPRYQRFARIIDAYYAANQAGLPEKELDIFEENVVLALRGDRSLTAGPKTISMFLCSRKFEIELQQRFEMRC